MTPPLDALREAAGELVRASSIVNDSCDVHAHLRVKGWRGITDDQNRQALEDYDRLGKAIKALESALLADSETPPKEEVERVELIPGDNTRNYPQVYEAQPTYTFNVPTKEGWRLYAERPKPKAVPEHNHKVYCGTHGDHECHPGCVRYAACADPECRSQDGGE